MARFLAFPVGLPALLCLLFASEAAAVGVIGGETRLLATSEAQANYLDIEFSCRLDTECERSPQGDLTIVIEIVGGDVEPDLSAGVVLHSRLTPFNYDRSIIAEYPPENEYRILRFDSLAFHLDESRVVATVTYWELDPQLRYEDELAFTLTECALVVSSDPCIHPDGRILTDGLGMRLTERSLELFGRHLGLTEMEKDLLGRPYAFIADLDPVLVPEPASAVLLAVGCAVLGRRRGRRSLRWRAGEVRSGSPV